ncbi:MAG TPA: hypothetical protein VFW07_06640 [Parafilimonas sp.]|nr:hypothetical protein [Parafilimonas sp.]
MKNVSDRIYFLLFFIAFLSGCQRSIIWHLNAAGTLKDEEGVCFTAIVSGTYYNGVIPAYDTAYVTVNVNVFTTGNYVISTDMQNGFRFIDSGVFNSAGMHTVKLKPVGKPISNKLTNFTITFDTSTCSLSLDVKDSSLLYADSELNTWEYIDVQTGIHYHGIINATYYLFTQISGLLSLRQEPEKYGDTSFQIGIVYPTEEITTGSFKTDTSNNVSLSANGKCINCAWNVAYVYTGAVATINVESYDASTGIIKGTFSGTTINWKNEIAPIKEGRFKARIKK